VLGGDREDDLGQCTGQVLCDHVIANKDVKTLRDAYEALNQGDIERALAVLDENAEWCEHSDLPEAGLYRGRAAIRSFLESFLESWENFTQETEDVRAGEECVLILLRSRSRGKGSGIAVEAQYAHLWTMRDGRGLRVDAYFDREEALSAMRAGAARQH
jgi:ketosteroid isomerase-like protein